MTIEHFNTDESHREPKDRCLNKLMYNKWITNVVVRQKSGPHLQVVPFERNVREERAYDHERTGRGERIVIFDRIVQYE